MSRTVLLLVGLAVMECHLAAVSAVTLDVFNSGLVLQPPSHPADPDTGSPDGGNHGARRRKQATTYDAETPQTMEDKLNQLRRTLTASNMNYANWNYDLEMFAAGLVTQCRLQTEAVIDGNKFPFVRGFTGIFQYPYSVAAQLQSAYNFGLSQSYYRQLMSSKMVEFACAVGSLDCTFYDISKPVSTPQNGKIFACIFSYRSDPDASVLYKSGVNCSACDNTTLWCDSGLCRNQCVLNNCDDCQTACSDCDQVTALSACRCVCYYGDVSTARCQSTAYSTSANPICSASSDDSSDEAYYVGMPVGWIACIIISSALLLSLALSVAIWHCVRNRICCVTRQGHRQTAPSPVGRENVASNVYEEFGPGFVPVLSPPAYMDTSIKPPPYDVTSLPTVDVKKTQEPSAPPKTYDNLGFPGENTEA